MARLFDGNDEILSAANAVSGFDVNVKSCFGAVYMISEPANAQVLTMIASDNSQASDKKQAMAINAPNVSGFRFHWTQDFSSVDGEWLSDNDFALNTWHYFAVAYDRSSSSNNPTLYVNGSLEAMTAWIGPTGTNATGDDTMMLGHNPTGGTLWLNTGALAEICWWNTGLSGAQLASLDGTINPTDVAYSNIIWYSPLYGGSLTAEWELIQRLTLTVTGARDFIHPPVPKHKILRMDTG